MGAVRSGWQEETSGYQDEHELYPTGKSYWQLPVLCTHVHACEAGHAHVCACVKGQWHGEGGTCIRWC